tara:strand:+ start:195 stop:389 length:195 start_codon:yes stop_codon:yes gene_type:complete
LDINDQIELLEPSGNVVIIKKGDRVKCPLLMFLGDDSTPPTFYDGDYSDMQKVVEWLKLKVKNG